MDDINPRFACLGLINLWLPKKRWVSTVLVLDYLTFRLFLGLSTNCSIAAKPALLSLWINLNQLLGIVGQVFVDDNSFYTICEPAWYKLAYAGICESLLSFFFFPILLLTTMPPFRLLYSVVYYVPIWKFFRTFPLYICVCIVHVCACECVCNGIVIKFFYQDHSFFFPSFPVLVNGSIEYIKVLMAGLAIYAFWYNLWAKSSTDNWQPFNQTYFLYDTPLFLFFGYVHI